ncbi:MAG: hypothetical protein KZQ72_17235 [Candidatus Thiodiazotropha sp. (ex Cardiolucina cf. quadrata)]|nr:hypothetical protein [Candidatus Thiodiazotropha sp. (ex Cardiolucina cf. quadrata)]
MFLEIMTKRPRGSYSAIQAGIVSMALTVALGSGPLYAYTSEDGSVQASGFVENASYSRRHVGLSKMRNTVQVEGSKD